MGSNPTLSAILASIVGTAALCACGSSGRPLALQGATMGSTYSVQVPRPPPDVDRRVLERIVEDLLADVNSRLSTWAPDSEISAINRAVSMEWLPVSPPLHAVVKAALEIESRSGGAFDISVAPLVAAWGFGSANGPTGGAADRERVVAARARVGEGALLLRDSPPALRKSRADVQLDVDGIAPGYAVDELARRIRALGITDVLVEIGGEVTAFGRATSDRPWRIAIEMPLAGERRPYAIVELDGMSISTSGDYRDFRIVDGRRISHTIDPHSGAPVAHDLASVSVIHESAMYADAYATALMVLGPVEGPALARQLGLAALFLSREPGSGRVRETTTAEFAKYRRPLQ